MYELGRSRIRRRTLLAKILLAPLLFIAKGFGIASAAIVPTEEELKPFREIAARKGAKYVFGSRKLSAAKSGAPLQMHLDMDMVRASLNNAIERTKKQKHYAISERLERLLANGTAAQQVDFVLGSGDKYFFPEDVETWAKMAEANKFHSFGVVCDEVCFIICKCSCWRRLEDCVQQCTERCRQIFC